MARTCAWCKMGYLDLGVTDGDLDFCSPEHAAQRLILKMLVRLGQIPANNPRRSPLRIQLMSHRF
jgi:hypothetical protein